MAVVRITSKGQVTIPVEVRERAGLLPHTDVEFAYDGHVVTVTPVRTGVKRTRGRLIADRLVGKGDVPLTTDQIMALTRGEP